jgi:hypothetical protein
MHSGIHTRQDTNRQHLSKFTTLTKPRPYFLSLWRARRRTHVFFALPCLLHLLMKYKEMKKRLTIGSRESDQCANSKTHHCRHQREHFPGILHINVLLVSTFCHSPIHKSFHSSSNLGCPLQPP